MVSALRCAWIHSLRSSIVSTDTDSFAAISAMRQARANSDRTGPVLLTFLGDCWRVLFAIGRRRRSGELNVLWTSTPRVISLPVDEN